MAADCRRYGANASLLPDTLFSAFTEGPWRQIAAATEKYVALFTVAASFKAAMGVACKEKYVALFTVAAAFRAAVVLGECRPFRHTSPVSPATFSAR